MAYGLRVNNTIGDAVYDTSSIGWFQILQFEVEANASELIRWTDIGFDNTNFDLLVNIQMVNVPPNDQEGYTPDASVNIIRVKVQPFPGLTSEKVIAIVLARNSTGAIT